MKKIKEEEIFKSPVFNLVRKTFEDIPFKPYGLNCADWVMVLITDKPSDGCSTKAVFVDQTRWGLEDKTTEFPCGTVDKYEVEVYGREDARLKAAIREVKEETGLDIQNDNIKKLVSFNPNPAYFNNTMTIFSVVVPDLEKVFAERSKQELDEFEDCVPYIADIADKKEELSKHAMGIAALFAAGYHLD